MRSCEGQGHDGMDEVSFQASAYSSIPSQRLVSTRTSLPSSVFWVRGGLFSDTYVGRDGTRNEKGQKNSQKESFGFLCPPFFISDS